MEVGYESATMTDRELAASNSTGFLVGRAVDIKFRRTRCSDTRRVDLAVWLGGVPDEMSQSGDTGNELSGNDRRYEIRCGRKVVV